MSVNRSNTILVVDDERGVCQSFSMVFKNRHHVLVASSGKEAIDIFTKKTIDLILLDILLPDTNGIELLKQFKDTDPTVEVVMVTAVKEIKTAVKAIKLGAYDYIIKPFDVDHVLNRAKRALEKRSLVKEVSYLRNELDRLHLFEKMVGRDYPKKSIELQNVEAAKRTVVEGYGITITPEIAVRREIHLGLLKPIDLAGFDLYFDYYLFFLKGKTFSKAAEAFIELVSGIKLFSNPENLSKSLIKNN